MSVISFGQASKNRPKVFYIVYSIFMLLSYYSYVLLDDYRLGRSSYWMSKSSITPQDLASINRLGNWVSTLESVFFYVFLLAYIGLHIYSKKNANVLMRFLLFNGALFAGIAAINYIIFLVAALPIGNLMQPLIWPLNVLVMLLIYVLWLKFTQRIAHT